MFTNSLSDTSKEECRQGKSLMSVPYSRQIGLWRSVDCHLYCLSQPARPVLTPSSILLLPHNPKGSFLNTGHSDYKKTPD